MRGRSGSWPDGGIRDAGEGGEECGVVAEVGSIGVAGVGQVGGEAGAAYTGGVVEGGYFEAGVVGEDEEARGVEGVVDGLGAGVGLEGGLVLGRGGNGGEAGEGFDADGGGGLAARAKSRSLPGLVVAAKRSMGTGYIYRAGFQPSGATPGLNLGLRPRLV